MPLIMSISKDGQGHKDKYLDTSRKILSQELLMCNMKVVALAVQVNHILCKIEKKNLNRDEDVSL